ncbi:CRISPR system precrRNA processing endoribonuclease RAMP protein Cas6 [Gammaproteobacteria bacterium AB-CW1]|uniref:CRISPR system precrRNA processing endoribonuclease RAMP protein Cas6 n=1 Tax=Natronospira elongata TaxID=3110268 RepID=A0AAP6JGP0_9GAMM|nr:CRISPR system precrRNA processing endoribonuclease RAMP protein Cas6 [Gammaproteobacteria bacterium AB-CW1]
MPHPSSQTDLPRLVIGFYRLRFAVHDRYDYPGFSGSAWRGVLGHALRERHCPRGLHRACDCDPACDYARLFEPPLPADTHGLPLAGLDRLPSPWLLHELPEGPVARGETLTLGLSLLGTANAGLPAYVQALAEGAGRLEMADNLKLVSVARWHRAGGLREIDADQPQAAGPSEAEWLDQAGILGHAGPMRVRLLTPMRLRVGGRHLGQRGFDPGAFCMAVVRRVSLLAAVYGPGPVTADFRALKAACADVRLHAQTLQWEERARRSNRQGARHQLGGLSGAFELDNVAHELVPWLLLGQAVHVGKAVSMGLGRFHLEPAS